MCKFVNGTRMCIFVSSFVYFSLKIHKVCKYNYFVFTILLTPKLAMVTVHCKSFISG